jgi:hypothetical protein
MRPFRPIRSSALILLLMGNLVSWVGCGSNLPSTGTMATPVDPKVSAEQNKSMQDFYKNTPKAIPKYTREHR